LFITRFTPVIILVLWPVRSLISSIPLSIISLKTSWYCLSNSVIQISFYHPPDSIFVDSYGSRITVNGLRSLF